MKPYTTIITTTFYCLLAFTATSQPTVPPLNGWNMQQQQLYYLFTPKTLLKTGVTYEIMPPVQAGDSSIANWLDNRVLAEIKAAGYTPGITQVASRPAQQYQTFATNVTDARGRKWTISFIAFQQTDKTIRYARIMLPSTYSNTYLKPAVGHFMKWSKQAGIASSGTTGNAATSPNTSSRSTTGKSATRNKKAGTPVTAPGAGLKPADIKGVAIHLEYGTGVGGMMITEYRPYLMLKDGSVFKYPDCSPYDLDVATSRQTQPTRWGTWKLEGKTLVVTLPEKNGMETDRWEQHWFWTIPAKPGEKITGSFTTISGGGNTALGGSAMTFSSANLSFNQQGQFTYERTGGGSNSAAGTSVSAYSSQNKAGTYTLNEFGLELKFNNGQVKRSMFYFYPDSHTTFGVNDDAYVAAKK